ncbi:MAG: deoxynucleoside kinase [Gammaproteobacteria bacterium]|nr:deoxynucleoside kinase [Gammaproteobacteria bacterium]MCW8839540.1 deoxynucleoside kinase [Gammaproteobacteria bacterium]MCW8928430.1 deoxynucleoside kinase [Gammaproteobacteria bacterium]MCW8959772.1 deoxynucleoside kinase [Gammaproteobacteria bacterium]MCW8972937.1 deoxynucleoside kinase [Gammaproteobacteria bacterium]
MSDPRFIVVEGPIGVGKTTLAHRLAETFGSELLLEGAEENPFLERFYLNPREAALPTQMFFLFQRARQMQALRQGDMFEPVRVSDFMLEKDRLFATLTLDSDELRLYEQAYELLTLDAPTPDLVIYLQAPVEVLQQRVARRGRRGEERMVADYLRSVSDAYARFFYDYDSAPLLIVNAAEIDLAASDKDYIMLLEQIREVKCGRHYFNPIPSML